MPWHLMPDQDEHTNTTFSLAPTSRPRTILSFYSVPLLNYCRDQVLSFSLFFFNQQTHSLQLVISPSPADIPTSPAKMQFTLLTIVTLFAAAIAAPLKGEEDCEYFIYQNQKMRRWKY